MMGILATPTNHGTVLVPLAMAKQWQFHNEDKFICDYKGLIC